MILPLAPRLMPTTGGAACCACAESGQATADSAIYFDEIASSHCPSQGQDYA
jgi:hypothetical protein